MEERYYERAVIAERAINRAGKAFGPDFEREFYIEMMAAKEIGFNRWHRGEESFYREKVLNGVS